MGPDSLDHTLGVTGSIDILHHKATQQSCSKFDLLFLKFSLEREQGLPSVAMMDPANTTKESSQTGFIRYILVPLFESLKKVRIRQHPMNH